MRPSAGSLPWRNAWNRAGISLRHVRSPVAPKKTRSNDMSSPESGGAQPRQQAGGRRVEPTGVAAGQARQQVVGHRLAELDTPLVERVDPPQRAGDEHAVLVERDQPPEAARRQAFE